MKRILTIVIFGIISSSVFSQSLLVGPEYFDASFGTTAGIFTRNTTGNQWTRVVTSTNPGASVNRFTVGTTLLTLTNNVSTVGYTGIQVRFREWVTGVFPTNQVVLEYSINGGLNWANSGFVSSATTSVPSSPNASVTLPVSAEGVSTLKVRFTFSGANLTTGTQTYKIDDFAIYGTPPPTFYYNVTGEDLSLVTSWGTSTDGSGTHPSSFNEDNQTFYIVNGSTATTSTDWTVSGTGSKIVVGDGTNPIVYTIPEGTTLNVETLNVLGQSTLVNASDAYLPTLGTVATNSTVSYTYNGDVNVYPTTYYNLTLSGSGIKYLNGGSDYEVDNVLDISSLTGNVYLDANKLTLKGSIVGSAEFTGTSSTQIEIDKTAGSVGTIDFADANNTINNLTIVSGSLTLGSNLTLGGSSPTIMINTNSTLDGGVYQITGDLATTELVDILGTFKTANPNGFSKGASTAFTSNIANPVLGENSTVEYNATTGIQIITARPQVESYANLVLSGAAIKQFNDITEGYSINKNFTYSGGSVSIAVGAPFKYAGTGAQNIAPLSYSQLTLGGSGNKTLTDSTKIVQELTIEGTAVLVSNGYLIVESLPETRTANVIDNTGTNSISGNIVMKRYIRTTRAGTSSISGLPVMLSSPVQTTLSNFQPTNLNFYEYISTNAGTKWTKVNVSNATEAGKGYLLRAQRGSTYYLKGPVNYGNVTRNLTQGDNYNLVGNPYPCSIEWDPAKITMTNLGMSRQIYVYNNTTSGSNYQLLTLDALLAPCQGFFVVADGPSSSVTFTNSAKVSDRPLLYRVENEDPGYTNRLEVYLKRGEASDMAVIWPQEEADGSMFVNKFDGKKLMPDTAVPAVFLKKQDQNLVLFTFSTSDNERSVPVYFRLPKDTVYAFNFKDTEKIDPLYNVYLVDSAKGTLQNIRNNNSYSFSGNASTKGGYSVLFTKSVVSSLQDLDKEDKVTVYSENGNAHFRMDGIPSGVIITDMAGTEVFTTRSIANNNFDVNLSSASRGIYIATIEVEGRMVHKRFILNK